MPDDRRVVSASDNDPLRVWDLDTGRITLLEIQGWRSRSCAFLALHRDVEARGSRNVET